MRLLSGRVDVLSPLQVGVEFPQIPRRTPSFIGGDPVDLIDYRTVPVLIVEGNSTASVGGKFVLHHNAALHCVCGTSHNVAQHCVCWTIGRNTLWDCTQVVQYLDD